MSSGTRLKADVEVHPAMPVRDCVAMVREAEELGFDTVWFADTHMLMREAYVILGAVAAADGQARLGTSVTNVVTRHASVIASAFATLHELRPGRVLCGVGVGDSALRTIGMKPMKRADLEADVELLRGLWRRDPRPGGQDGIALSWLAEALEIPVYYGASGPKMLQDAGRICDGVVSYVGLAGERVQTALDHIRHGAEAGGRRLEDLEIVWWVPLSVDEDSARAKAAVKAHVSRAILHAEPLGLPADEQAVADRLRQQYEWYDHMAVGSGHSQIVPDELVTRYAVAGTARECVQQLRQLVDLGLDHVGVIPMSDDRGRVIRDFARDVLPHV
jgi:5,10-methylenetetrahydromethanopterin reductase